MKKRTLLLTVLTLALAGIAAPTQADAKIKSTIYTNDQMGHWFRYHHN